MIVVKSEHQQYCVLGTDAWRFGVLVSETSLKNEMNFGLCPGQPVPGISARAGVGPEGPFPPQLSRDRANYF